MKLLIAFLSLSLANFSNTLFACTIFMANDQKHVWIGNNEDESPTTRYRVWYMPKEKHRYGYMLWSEKIAEHEAVMWQYPQGGLNEAGLFMDYTAIDNIPVKSNPAKKDREQEVINHLLQNYSTVDEALAWISQFNLVKLSGAQLFIADASGNYATVHGNYIITKSKRNFSLTNYCIDNGYQEACWRRETASKRLNELPAFNEKQIAGILAETAQKWPGEVVTNYSMAIDLKQQKITLYLKGDFTTPVGIDLAKELRKGKHHLDLVDYFPINVASLLKNTYTKAGIANTLQRLDSLQLNARNKYNFNNSDVIAFAAELIAAGKSADALALFGRLKTFRPNTPLIDNWLGIAYRHQGDTLKANSYFQQVLRRYPDDYLANLYLERPSQKVRFKIRAWSGAQKVKVIGSFTKWLEAPIEMHQKDGYWFAEINIPKGSHQYKFLVDDRYYLADPENIIFLQQGDNFNSLLLR